MAQCSGCSTRTKAVGMFLVQKSTGKPVRHWLCPYHLRVGRMLYKWVWVRPVLEVVRGSETAENKGN